MTDRADFQECKARTMMAPSNTNKVSVAFCKLSIVSRIPVDNQTNGRMEADRKRLEPCEDPRLRRNPSTGKTPYLRLELIRRWRAKRTIAARLFSALAIIQTSLPMPTVTATRHSTNYSTPSSQAFWPSPESSVTALPLHSHSRHAPLVGKYSASQVGRGSSAYISTA
jgi:hypothetical protein